MIFVPGANLATDRTVRFLAALRGASTSRVLNLHRIAVDQRDNAQHQEAPFFASPIVNRSFVLKHRIRADESYLFPGSRTAATKIIIPVDVNDLKAGGRSVLVEQRGYTDALRAAGNYHDEALQRDLWVLKLLDAVPSLDPFLLREYLRNNQIEVAPCYFAISDGDQERMYRFVKNEMTQLVVLAGDDAASGRMVSALLSNQIDEKLEPLRATLGLSPKDFREGVFSWRGFLYYKWSMESFWPDVVSVLREINKIQPIGAVSAIQREDLAAQRRAIIEMVRDNGNHVNKVLAVYDTSFRDLVEKQTPKTFRDFLMSAPHLFLELGEKLGAISHIVSFWRYRFQKDAPANIDADELALIFHDFCSGFGERAQDDAPLIKRPTVIDTTAA
jgi:hypothetical protein